MSTPNLPFLDIFCPLSRRFLQKFLQILFSKAIHLVTKLTGQLRPALLFDEALHLLFAHADDGAGHPLPAAIALVGHRSALQELRLLPGIGEVKAAAILEYRLEHGPFSDVAGLLEVPGRGEATLEGFRDYVCVDTQEDDS